MICWENSKELFSNFEDRYLIGKLCGGKTRCVIGVGGGARGL